MSRFCSSVLGCGGSPILPQSLAKCPIILRNKQSTKTWSRRRNCRVDWHSTQAKPSWRDEGMRTLAETSTKVSLLDSILKISSRMPLNHPYSASFARARRSSRLCIQRASPDIKLCDTLMALYKLFWFRLVAFLISFFLCRRRSTSSAK